MRLQPNYIKVVIYQLPHTKKFCSKCKYGEPFTSESFKKDAYICKIWCKACSPDGCPKKED